MLEEDEVWKVLDSYFTTYGMVRHQIEGFDCFLANLLPRIVNEIVPIRVGPPENMHTITICKQAQHRGLIPYHRVLITQPHDPISQHRNLKVHHCGLHF